MRHEGAIAVRATLVGTPQLPAVCATAGLHVLPTTCCRSRGVRVRRFCRHPCASSSASLLE